MHGLRKVGIRLQLHLYRAPACEMQRFIRCGVLLRPSPEHRRDHGWWRIFELRSAHSLPRGAGAQKLVKIYVHLRNCLFLGDGSHLLGRGVSARWPKLRGRELAEGARPEFSAARAAVEGCNKATTKVRNYLTDVPFFAEHSASVAGGPTT